MDIVWLSGTGTSRKEVLLVCCAVSVSLLSLHWLEWCCVQTSWCVCPGWLLTALSWVLLLTSDGVFDGGVGVSVADRVHPAPPPSTFLSPQPLPLCAHTQLPAAARCPTRYSQPL
jgi:hypothetical protein